MTLAELIRRAPVLGSGSDGTVYKVKTKSLSGMGFNAFDVPYVALKVVKASPKAREEARFTKVLDFIGAKCYGAVELQGMLYIAMQIVTPAKKFIESATKKELKKFAFELISKVYMMIDAGYVHNDLHLGNVAYANNQALIVDFGFVEKINKVTGTVRRQLIIAQLYALCDHCNDDNYVFVTDEEGDEVTFGCEFIAEHIYNLKRNEKNKNLI